MGIDAIAGNAAYGLSVQTGRLEESAARVAEPAPVPEPEPVQAEPAPAPEQVPTEADAAEAEAPAAPEPYTVDLVQEQVVQIESRAAFQANLAVLETADDMHGELLDIKA